MGRNKVAIPIRGVALSLALTSEGSTSEVCKRLGVTRQALHTWLKDEMIPPRRLSDMAKIFNWEQSLISSILDTDKSIAFLRARVARLESENNRLRNAIKALAVDEHKA